LNRDTGQRELVLMRWGLIPFWAKEPSIGLRTTTAKAETITTAPAFREANKFRRFFPCRQNDSASATALNRWD
jgi:putative SOS response-associated peptidase YedK